MMRLLVGLLLLLAARPALAQPDGDWSSERSHRRGGGARILVLKDYHLDAGQTTRGPVVVIGGHATIDGTVDDDVVVLGGRLRLGPDAEVGGDAVAVGGGADIDAKARVHGEVTQTAVRWPDGDWDWEPLPRSWASGIGLIATFMRLLLILVVGSLLTLIAPGWVRRIAWRAAEAPGASILAGVACELAFVPAVIVVIVALAISIVGIPLIGVVPFLVAATAMAATAGFTAVAARIGARIRGTTVEHSQALFVDVLLGFAAVTALTVIARVVSAGSFWTSPFTLSLAGLGWLIEWMVWTVGIGAVSVSLLSRWHRPLPAGVPPVPPTAPAPTPI